MPTCGEKKIYSSRLEFLHKILQIFAVKFAKLQIRLCDVTIFCEFVINFQTNITKPKGNKCNNPLILAKIEI